MATECNQLTFEFHGLIQQQVKARFDGGTMIFNAEMWMCCSFQEAARKGLVGSTRFRLLQPPGPWTSFDA